MSHTMASRDPVDVATLTLLPSTPPSTQNSRKKVIPLTSVRGIAALMIYALHIWRVDEKVPMLVQNLRCVVTLFFVLSGYMMVYCYHTCTFNNWRCKMAFMIRRFGRIYPPLIVAYLWSMYLLEDAESYQFNALRIKTAPFLIYSLVACTEDNFFSDFTHHWAVSVEFLFYILLVLLFPALIYAYKKAKFRWFWWFMSWVVAPVVLYMWIVVPIFLSFTGGFPEPYNIRACELYLLFPFRVPECLLGVWIGYLALRYIHPVWERASVAIRQGVGVVSDIALLSMGVIVVYLIPMIDFLYGTRLVNYCHSGMLTPLSMPTVLLLSLDSGVVATILRCRPLEVLGEISYEVYLIHFAVTSYFSPVYGFEYHEHRFILSLPVTLFVSYILARVYSEPMFKQIVSVITCIWLDIKCTCKESILMTGTYQLLPAHTMNNATTDSDVESSGINAKATAIDNGSDEFSNQPATESDIEGLLNFVHSDR